MPSSLTIIFYLSNALILSFSIKYYYKHFMLITFLEKTKVLKPNLAN